MLNIVEIFNMLSNFFNYLTLANSICWLVWCKTIFQHSHCGNVCTDIKGPQAKYFCSNIYCINVLVPILHMKALRHYLTPAKRHPAVTNPRKHVITWTYMYVFESPTTYSQAADKADDMDKMWLAIHQRSADWSVSLDKGTQSTWQGSRVGLRGRRAGFRGSRAW